MNEEVLNGSLARGETGRATEVVWVQEWLVYHDCRVKIDGDFGPATASAVERFQIRSGLPATGVVDAATYEVLIAPRRRAEGRLSVRATINDLTVAYARQHLAERPREIGGQNRGPWVRLYMDGMQGADWPWCAGFVSFCLRQAAETLGVAIPIVTSVSCDSLAASAKSLGRFVAEPARHARSQIKPGWLFLSRRTPTDWVHVGVVTEASMDVMDTIEGNTNDDGSRDGYEACARMRGYPSTDFIRID